jgi:hypothetical protein
MLDFAALGVIASFLGPLALLLAVAGLIVYLVYEFKFKEKPKDPMQEFIFGSRVRDMGLFMDVTAVDYLDIIPPKDGTPSYAGLSFKSSASKYIHVDNSVPDARKIDMIDECTSLPDSVWSLSTNYQGISSIWTSLKGSAVLLSVLDNGSITVLPRPDKYTTDKDGNPIPVPSEVYNKKVAQQQWTFDMVSSASDRRSASCRVRNGTKYLKQVVGKNFLELSDDSANSLWTLDMQQVAPSSFSYMASGDETVWPLTEDDMDEHIFPVPVNPYTASYPLKWTVSPPFPSSSKLELVAGNDNVDDGTIRIKPGTLPGLMPAQVFTVQSTVKINNKTFTVSAKVNIEIAPSDDNDFGSNLEMSPSIDNDSADLDVENEDVENEDVENENDDLWPMTDLTLYVKQNSATALFLLSQISSIQFLQDPVVKMFVNLMQKAITGRWYGDDYKSTFFPNLPNTSPNSLTVPVLKTFDYREAVSGFIAKAAYGSDGNIKVGNLSY